MRAYSHLNSAVQILTAYNGHEPFSLFLKRFFGEHKKFGSRDRKEISQLCYSYFRLGKAAPALTQEERILLGLFLSLNKPNEVLSSIKPEWAQLAELSLAEKLEAVAPLVNVHDIFPWESELSVGVEQLAFSKSFLIQPDLFLRIRPGYETIVRSKLKEQNIGFTEKTGTCLALENQSRVQEWLVTDKEYVVQDMNSQLISEMLKIPVQSNPGSLKAWDCCAASGGKSILLFDIDQKIRLTVSDIRQSILANLKARFATAGLTNYRSLVLDLTRPVTEFGDELFDLIICDAPCTGSGTWARTPEQLFYFEPENLDHYTSLQEKITANAVPLLARGGYFLYITCSVFRRENEERASGLASDAMLELIDQRLFSGYADRADSLFAALFRKL
jgi:16S rRNA (cytosine967-C5)-methyltransferase